MADFHLPFVSVIIPVFNDTERLIQCLHALAQQTYPRDGYEVIVVDNSSTPDPTLSPLVEVCSNITLAHEAHRGSYAARNNGLSLAQGSVIAFTDSDCLPNLDWLERGVDWLTRHPDCGFVAGQIRFSFQNPDSPNVAELYDSRYFLKQKTYVEESHFGATANLFTFKSRFETIGLFKSDILSGGDQEWGRRVFVAGYPLLYADDVIISHPARHSFREVSKKVLRVTTGNHYLHNANDQPILSFMAEVLIDLKPHIRYAAEQFKDSTIQGWRRKLGCYLIYIAMRYLKSGRRIQLYLRHHWLRPLKSNLKGF